MRVLYLLSVFIHIFSAAVWIGGMCFFAFVVVPVLRNPSHAKSSGEFLHQVGRRFRALGWGALGVLLVTGLFQLSYRGFCLKGCKEAWESPLGKVLALKLLLVACVVGLSLCHDFFVGTRASELLRRDPRGQEAQRMRRLASLLGRGTLLLSLAILFLAILLVRGLP